MGVLDPDEGKIQQRAFVDPFLRPGFKPEETRPDFDSLPPDYDPFDVEVELPQSQTRPAGRPGIGPSGQITIDQLVAESSDDELPKDDDDSKPSDFALTDDQRYMLIGLAVIGAFFGLLK
tara:strand:- start:81 stop:440 length:360 start_codon:yes stop_codon:yes gene_type:complete